MRGLCCILSSPLLPPISYFLFCPFYGLKCSNFPFPFLPPQLSTAAAASALSHRKRNKRVMKRREEGGLAQGGREDCLRRQGGIAIFSLVVNFGNLICIKSPPSSPRQLRKESLGNCFFRFSGRGYCPAEARLERGKLNFLGT